jgi:hypothetical protein
MKTIEFTSKKGTKLQGTVKKTSDNTLLTVTTNGITADFFGIPNGLQTYKYNGQKVIIELSDEEKAKVYSTMWPEKTVVEVWKEWTAVECVISGEAMVKYQTVKMLDGSVKTIEKYRREL